MPSGSSPISRSISNMAVPELIPRRHGPVSARRTRRYSAQAAWAIRPAGLADGRERHHLAIIVAEIPPIEIFGLHAERRIGLYVHFFDAAAIHEVVDVLPAPRGGKIRVDGVEGQPERPGLFLIDDDFQLWAVVLPERPDVPQQRLRRARSIN